MQDFNQKRKIVATYVNNSDSESLKTPREITTMAVHDE